MFAMWDSVFTTKTEAEIVKFDSWVVGSVQSVVTLTDNDVG